MNSDNSKNDDILVEEDKSSTSTSTPVIEATSDDADGAALKATRSRRPTMVNNLFVVSPSVVESEIEPPVKEPWTVKRVFKVTWTYVTTVKVTPLPPNATDGRLGILDHDVYVTGNSMGRHVISVGL
jgi:hypothetical protein